MMKKIIILLFVTVFFACGQNGNPEDGKNGITRHDSLLNVIKSAETAIHNNMKAAVLDPKLANDALNNYLLFSREFPQDTNTAVFLFKASDIYVNAMRQYDQGISILEKIIDEYPRFRKLPLCYFEIGVIYDDNLNDDAKAKIYYEKFLKKFPTHPLAPQVKSLISYLGKSNEELLKEFEKKNK